MIKQNFLSEKSNDSINISYFKKSHKSNLDVMVLDNVTQHMELLTDVTTFLKDNGIQWICIPITADPVIPENTLFFKHEKFNRICCHIEGFETFYVKNLLSMIDVNKVYMDTNQTKPKNGWVIVQDKKKLKRIRFNAIKQDIENLIAEMDNPSNGLLNNPSDALSNNPSDALLDNPTDNASNDPSNNP